MEYARNALEIDGAEHEENAPNAPTLVIRKLSSPLAGEKQIIKIFAGSLLHHCYGIDEITEAFVCNYGLNTKYRESIERGKLKVSGVDLEGEVRAIELSDHPFFIGTLYQPQLSSSSENPHPLIISYLRAVSERNI